MHLLSLFIPASGAKRANAPRSTLFPPFEAAEAASIDTLGALQVTPGTGAYWLISSKILKRGSLSGSSLMS